MLGTHPIVRFLNQNRRQIRITILIILAFFLVLRILNNMAEKNIEKEIAEKNKIQSELALGDTHNEVIKDFINFCIKGDEVSAYALISSENKQKEFKTLNEFKTNYLLKYFSTDKKYDITYRTNIDKEYYYLVKIKEDILSTGKVNSETITQSFKVLQENGEEKITIQNN